LELAGSSEWSSADDDERAHLVEFLFCKAVHPDDYCLPYPWHLPNKAVQLPVLVHAFFCLLYTFVDSSPSGLRSFVLERVAELVGKSHHQDL
jgi:hypothetical protein